MAGNGFKEYSDRCKSAGRIFLSAVRGFLSRLWRVGTWPMAVRALLAVAVLAVGPSVLSDPLKAFTDSGVAASIRAGVAGDFTSLRQLERVALLRRIAGDADSVRELSGADLIMLFGSPGLRRAEPEAESWHYTSAECALDVYFPRVGDVEAKPAYAEYRVRGGTDGWVGPVGPEAAKPLDHRACLRSLFAQAE